MQPHIILNWPAIVTATVVAFLFGGLWYGPLFGRKWALLMGMDCDKKPDPKVMRKAFILQLIGLLLTSYVLTHTLQVWRPSAWGVGQPGQDGPDAMFGFFNGFFTWIGFYVPMQFGKVSWEGRPWKVFFINVGHDLVTLQIISQILAHWH